jgi:hypothetical protein
MAAGAGDAPEANVTLWQGRMAMLSVLSRPCCSSRDTAARANSPAGSPRLWIDGYHLLHLRHGGETTMDNVVPLCHRMSKLARYANHVAGRCVRTLSPKASQEMRAAPRHSRHAELGSPNPELHTLRMSPVNTAALASARLSRGNDILGDTSAAGKAPSCAYLHLRRRRSSGSSPRSLRSCLVEIALWCVTSVASECPVANDSACRPQPDSGLGPIPGA